MKRALFALLVLLAAAESSAQGDFVVNYRGLMAGRALVTNGFVDFYRTDTAYRVRLQGPTGLAANRTFTLPATLGSSGQALTTDGAGAMSWQTIDSTITHGVTARSGCVAGGISRSTSNLENCGAGLVHDGTNLIIGSGTTGAYIYDSGGITNYSSLTSGSSARPVNLSGETLSFKTGASYTIRASIAADGSTLIGSSALGSTTVPLTARLGTGSTANVFEMQNSAGTVLSSFDSTGRFMSPNGTTSLPGVGIGAGAYGWYRSGNAIGLSINTNTFTAFDGVWGGPMLGSAAYLVWKDGANAVTATGDVILGRCGAACLQFGLGITSGSAINQTIRSHNATTGTNISGGNLTITAPGGTGSSTGGTIAFQTAPVLASGTTAQTPVDRLTIGKSGTVTIGTLASGANVTALAVNAPNSSSGSPSQWPFYVQVQSGRYFSTWAEGAGTNSGGFSITTGSPAGMNFWWNPQAGGTANIAFNRTVGSAATVTGPQITMNASSLDLQVSNGSALYTGFNMASTGAVTLGGSTITGTTVAATINNGTSTGNILNVQDNGTNVFTVADGGHVAFNGVTTSGSTANPTVLLGSALGSSSINLGSATYINLNNSAYGISIGGAGGLTYPTIAMAATTPASPSFQTGSPSNSYQIFNRGSYNYDFQNADCGTSSCTHPTLILRSINNSTTEYLSLKHNGTNGVISAGTGSVQFNSLGIKLTTGTKPACDSSTRGTQFYVAGGAGVADTYEVCRKDAGDAYAWVSIF